MTAVVLYDYWRSTASYRVRIVLALADITYKKRSVDLLAGQQNSPQHVAVNPQGFVPVLDIDNTRLTQSLAIIEYLNETRDLGLLPNDPTERARLRSLAQIIACDTHPVCNPSVVSYATKDAQYEDQARAAWMKHFIRRGLVAFEAAVETVDLSPFTNGMSVGLPEICLVPQLYNARRWGVDYGDLNKVSALLRLCQDRAEFAIAAPEPQGQSQV